MIRALLLLILLIFVLRAVWRLLDGLIEGIAGPRSAARPKSAVKMERDPVCGTFVVPGEALTLSDGHERLYFCSTSCRDAYRAKTA
jgi:uncharacterized protein